MSRTELGTILGGLSPRQISDLAKSRHVVQVDRGKFDLFESIDTYCRYQRRVSRLHTSADGTVDAVAESALLKRANREIIEMRRAQLEGKLISIDEIEELWGHIMRTFRSMLQAVPSRVAFSRPHLTKDDIKAIQQECLEILRLNALGDMKVGPLPAPEKEKA